GSRRNRVCRIPYVLVPVLVPVDAVRRPGTGDELGDALGSGGALRLRVPAALLVELGGEQRRVDGRAEVAPLLYERLIERGHGTLGEPDGPPAGAVRTAEEPGGRGVGPHDEQRDEAQAQPQPDPT